MGGFTRRLQIGWWVGKLSLKLMSGKDLIKNIKNAAFLRERVNYENFKLLEIFYIFPTEERKGNKKKKAGEMNWLISE